VTDIQNFCDRNSIMHNKNQMPPVTFFNKVRIVSLAQDGKSSTQIAATLGIPRITIILTYFSMIFEAYANATLSRY
jgi:hypothetical protein